MGPPKELFNQTPTNITQINRMIVGVLICIIGVVFIYYVWKLQTNQKIAVKESSPAPVVRLTASQDELPELLEKHKNENPENMGIFVKPRTPQEIERQMIVAKEIELKKEVVDEKTETQIELQKIHDNDEIEKQKLDLAAQESSMTIPVPKPPGVADQSPQSNSPVLDGAVDKIENAVDALKNKTPDQPKDNNDINNQDEKLNFLKSGPGESDYLKKGLEIPKSPYEVKAGTFIPAVLIVGINTDMPGSVTAQVSENVYDTVTGNYILIPQGTKVVGEYDSKVSYGQSRVEVVWNRLIYPDGSSIDIERMQGADISGMAGLHDKLNNHYFKLYSNALLLSFVGAGYNILNNQQSQTSPYSAQQQVAASVGQELSTVASKSIEKNMDVQPTITISPGTKFTITVMKDMILKEVKDMDGTLDIQ